MKDIDKSNDHGFSLVELIVVIAIMAVLVGMLAPTLIGNIEKSRESSDLQNLDSVRQAVVNAMADEDVYLDTIASVPAGASYITFAKAVSGGVLSVDSTYSKLSSKFGEIMNSGTDKILQSQAGKSGNLLVRVYKDGRVTVGVYANDSDMNAVEAVKNKKPLLAQ